MGDNYHTPFAAGVTQFTATSMNPAIASLDQAITYASKSPIVHCDGDITWAAGTLTWASTMRIIFDRTDGQAIQNTIATGSLAISDNEFCYVDLSETNNAVLSMAKAAVTTGAASNFLALNRFVLAYRNTLSDEIFSIWLPVKYTAISGAHARSHALDSGLDHTGLTAATADEIITVASITKLPKASGVKITAFHTRQHAITATADHTGITGATANEIVSLSSITLLPKASGMLITDFLDGRQNDCSTAGTQCALDWTDGGTQYMTLATASTRVTFSNPSAGKVYRLLVKQSAGGSDVIIWGSTIKWRGGSAPALTATGDSIDIATFVYIGSTWYGDIAKSFG